MTTRKFKYWTGTVNDKGQIMSSKTPHTNLRDAIYEARHHGDFNSCTAGVVLADEQGRSTGKCVFATPRV